jgi:hypothetical protein
MFILLVGSGLVLTDGFAMAAPKGDVLAAFGYPLAEGSPFTISVVTQPRNPAQNCAVSANGNGTVSRTSLMNPAHVVCR